MTDTNQKLREALLSDMDIAVLRMPVHLAFAGNMAQFQYHNRVQALLDRIEALATPTAEQVDDINVAESFTSVTKTAAPAQGEPFGYFRAEPFGWTDCSEDAEGAIALYEHPAAPAQEPAPTWSLREALQKAKDALSLALSDVDWRKDSPTQPVIHKAYNCAHQALALPTADHLPDAGKMIETATPVCERDAFEHDLSKSPFEFDMDRWPDNAPVDWPGSYKQYHVQCAWDAWQAGRAALRAGDAVDGPLIDEGSKPALSPLSDKDAIALIEEHTNDDNVLHAHEAIELIRSVERAHGIDTAMRKGQL